MLGISWIFLSAILLAGSSVTSLHQLDDEYKTAEMALQSVFGLNNTDQADTIKLLDKVAKVIGTIKSVFEGKSVIRPSNDDAKLEKFTDFIQNLIKRLKKYDDKDLEYFLTIFNDEIRKYNYRGCKFHELLENYNLRRFLSDMLSNLQNESGIAIKKSLEVIANKIEDDQFNKNEKNLVDFINSVYRQDSVEKFQNFLAQIDSYKLNSDKTDLDLVKIIKEGVRSIIFDYYSQLNNNVRNALKHQVDDFWNNLSQKESFQLEDSIKSSRAQNFRYKIEKKNNLTPKEIFDLKPDLKKDIMKSEVKKQSIYLLNSIKAPKTDKIKSFRNDEYVNISQTTLSDSEFIQIKNQKQDDNSGLQTISPLIFTTRLLKTRRKVLTFKTLYPDLVPEWTSVTLVPSRRFMSYGYPVRHHNAEKRKLFHKRGRVKGERLVKKLVGPVKVSIANSRLPRMKKNSLKFRHKVPVKKIGLRSRKPVRQLTTYKTERQRRMRPFRTNKELRTSKRRRLGIRGHLLFTQIENNYRRSNIIDSMVSEEGLSIDMPEIYQDNFRRSETNFTHPDPGSHQAHMTQSTPTNINNEIHNTTVIISDINNALPNEKDKFIKSKEEQNEFNVDRLNKVQKTFQIKSKVGDKNLTDVEIIKAFEVKTQPNNNWDAHKIFNEEKYQTVNNNEQTDHFYAQNKQDGSSVFNFRAKHTGNETEIESKRNKEKVAIYDENQHNKDIEVNNVKTDNDFKTFIEDYGNGLNEFTHYKIRNNGVTVNSELGNNIEKDIDTKTTPKTSLSSTTTTTVTESPITSAPTVVTTLLPPIGPSTILSVNEKQDLDNHDKTTIKSFFDANFIKHLMKTETHQTTTRNSAAGRYFNYDGVIIDSMEKLKEEVAEATNLNYEAQ